MLRAFVCKALPHHFTPTPMHKETLTLYELNQMVRESLAITMPDEYWVEAEISEMREVRGHCYMELVQKDATGNTPVAKASAKCWKNKWALLRPHFERNAGQMLRAGLKVRLLVYADFHEAYGFSWIVADIDPTYTLGDMARKRLEIVRMLKQQGVFDLQKELRLPLFTQRVAVISSEQAAGYGDFYRHLHENDWHLHFSVQLFTATMQGEGVERSVIAALDAINERLTDFDVVVIIRGGGATSDLSGFDSLPLAENVANFPLPIITGIGHDRDESVLDMVSFRRVKTPTAAAALLVEHLAETYQRVTDAQEEYPTSSTSRKGAYAVLAGAYTARKKVRKHGFAHAKRHGNNPSKARLTTATPNASLAHTGRTLANQGHTSP